jgi:hypothetical protein
MPAPNRPSMLRLSLRPAVLAGLAALALAAAGLAGCVLDDTADGTHDLEVAIAADAPSVSVRVEMFNGSIEVRAGAADRVTATVTTTGAGRSTDEAEADRAKIQVTLTANPDGSVLLRAIYQPDPGSPNNGSASAVVEVPPAAALDLRTSNGDVSTAKIAGPIQVATSNGAVRLAEVAAEATVRTSNKEVEVDGSGVFDIETSNAAIILRGTGATVRARTSNATVRFDGTFTDTAQSLETSNESVYVGLPAGSSFGLDARTSGGAEVVIQGFDVRTTGAASGGTLQGTVGSGGPSITLRTSNKNIEVSALP